MNDNNNEKKTPKRRIRQTSILIGCALLFIGLYIVINLESISAFASSVTKVLTPVILGFAIAYILNPVHKLFDKTLFRGIGNKWLRGALSLLCTYLFALIFFLSVALLVLPELLGSLSVFISSFDAYIDTTIADINAWVADYFGTHHVPDMIKKEDILNAVSQFFTESGDLFQALGSYIIQYGTGLVIGIKNIILALFISVYVLASKSYLSTLVHKLTAAFLTKKGQARFYRYARVCDKTFGGFLVGKIIDSMVISIIGLIVFMILDIPYYVLITAIMCVSNIIPVFGAFIGAIPCFFFIFIVDPQKALIFLVAVLILQQIDSNLLAPKILGSSTGISSLGVIIAIVIMGGWFGVIGMILGVPVFAVILTVINDWTEDKLKRKNLPLNTAEYSTESSPYAESHAPKTISRVIFTAAGVIFGKLIHLLSKNKNTKNTEKGSKENERND